MTRKKGVAEEIDSLPFSNDGIRTQLSGQWEELVSVDVETIIEIGVKTFAQDARVQTILGEFGLLATTPVQYELF